MTAPFAPPAPQQGPPTGPQGPYQGPTPPQQPFVPQGQPQGAATGLLDERSAAFVRAFAPLLARNRAAPGRAPYPHHFGCY